MKLVILTAIGVGMSTVIGSVIGFAIKRISHKFNDVVLGFAAGVMLAAAIIGLIIPSIEEGGNYGIVITAVGILVGALFLNLADKLTPHLHSLTGVDIDGHDSESKNNINRVLLFVMAIAIHNFPEGIAAGVGFGSDDIGNALSVALGIVLQNIPEGMIMVAPMLSVGISKKRTFLIAIFTGMVEVVGTLFGYAAVSVATIILPFALAFAGGTMLYVISDEMIPETHSHGYERAATYALLIGFILMMIMDYCI